MRLTMDAASLPEGEKTGNSRRASRSGRAAKRTALLLLLLAGPLVSGQAEILPSKVARTLLAAAVSEPVPAPARGRHTSGGPAPAGNAGEQGADPGIRDDTYRSTAKDLQLGLEDDRRAEAEAHFMYGLMLEDSSDADQAMDEYLKSLALDPADIDLSIKLAWEYLGRDDTPAAITLLKDTIKAAPKQAQPCLALAYLYLNTLNKNDLALKYATQALELDPDNIYCYQYLKEIYKASGQQQKIAPLLDRAAKSESKDPRFWLQLGALYVESLLKASEFSGSESGSLSAHEAPAKTSDELKRADAIFQEALAYANEDLDVMEGVADFYAKTQQLAEAIPLYKHVVETDPTRNGARENLARCYIGTNQKELAIATLEDLIKADPVQHHAYEFLAKLYEDTGQYEKAIANYEQSLLVTPNHSEAYEGLAELLIGQRFNKPDKAIAVLVEARKRFPDQPAFAYLLAIALEEAKQHQASVAMFEVAVVEAQNAQPGLLNAQFYLHYGEAAEQAGLYDQAAQFLRKSLDSAEEPELIAITSNYLGYMWVDHNLNVEEGGALIKRALEIEPDNGAYLDSLGWYYYRSNQFDKALPELTRAVELIKPEDPTVYEHLGDTYFKLNDTAKAVNCWQKAVKLDPANPAIPELNKKITETKIAPPTAAPASSAPATAPVPLKGS